MRCDALSSPGQAWETPASKFLLSMAPSSPRWFSTSYYTKCYTESSKTTAAFFPLLCTYINHQYNLDAHCVHLQHTILGHYCCFIQNVKLEEERTREGKMVSWTSPTQFTSWTRYAITSLSWWTTASPMKYEEYICSGSHEDELSMCSISKHS